MVKKVVLTGGPCCGKTTVINELEERGFKILREVARQVLEERAGYKVTKDEWKKRQILIFHRQRIAEEKLDGDFCFLDRGIIDSIAYSKILIDEIPFDFNKDDFMGCYNLVFVLDRLPFYKDDLRWEEDEDAEKIHNALISEYISFGYNVIRVPIFEADSLDEAIRKRVDFVLNYIGDLND